MIGFTGSYVEKSISAFEFLGSKPFSVLNLDILESSRGAHKIIKIERLQSEVSRENKIKELVAAQL